MASTTGRERKPITVLFADVVGSTAMAEQVDPEDWSGVMNRAFDLMAGAVHEYEGTVAQFLGDGILAFFGAPVSHEDDPQRAVWAALTMLEESTRLSSELSASTGFELEIRVGINTGPVIVGNVGLLSQGGYSALGDTLNTASRVQALAEPSTVAVTDSTYRLVSQLFEAEDLGEIRVKGKSAPVHCHRIVGPRAQPAGVSEPGGSPFVGRSHHLARLNQVVEALREGRGAVAVVSGEPGIARAG